jgi:hypothetical protein
VNPLESGAKECESHVTENGPDPVMAIRFNACKPVSPGKSGETLTVRRKGVVRMDETHRFHTARIDNQEAASVAELELHRSRGWAYKWLNR